MIVLGIDPGLTSTGWSVTDPAARHVFACGTFHRCNEKTIRDLHAIAERLTVDLVVIQVPLFEAGKRTPFFNKGGGMSLVRHAAYVYELAGYLTGTGYQVKKIPPTRNMGMKMDEGLWRRIWKYEGRVSEHARDAAQLTLAAGIKKQLDLSLDRD